ncbi:hypothetical protein [Microcoleus sp.]|uniref:hypothetical protein n=1 Tax=Microcoleus sp. TaxID=44472 RepID=UPI0035239C83
MTTSLADKVFVPEIVEPEEFSPVDLLWLAQGKFGWTVYNFADVFGWRYETIYKWTYGQKPSRQARIRAATLKKMWGI